LQFIENESLSSPVKHSRWPFDFNVSSQSINMGQPLLKWSSNEYDASQSYDCECQGPDFLVQDYIIVTSDYITSFAVF